VPAPTRALRHFRAADRPRDDGDLALKSARTSAGMYFADLTPYSYTSQPEACGASTRVLNVGWLDAPHAFPIGEVPHALVERLRMLVHCAITKTMGGSHPCSLPGAHDAPPRGNGEIIVVGGDGTHYHAPRLIHHYVTAHRYQPPQAFIDAVLRTAHITWREARRDDLCLACGHRMVCSNANTGSRSLKCPACQSWYAR
jgi:hypothetical protein